MGAEAADAGTEAAAGGHSGRAPPPPPPPPPLPPSEQALLLNLKRSLTGYLDEQYTPVVQEHPWTTERQW
jgi:hypothetical protein